MRRFINPMLLMHDHPARRQPTPKTLPDDFIARCEVLGREHPAAVLSADDPTEAVEGAFGTDSHTRRTAKVRMRLAARQRIDEILASDLAATTAAKALAEEEQKKARDRELFERITASILGFTKDAGAETAGGAALKGPAPAEASAVIQGVQRVTRIIELIEAEIGPLSGKDSNDARMALFQATMHVFGVGRLKELLGA